MIEEIMSPAQAPGSHRRFRDDSIQRREMPMLTFEIIGAIGVMLFLAALFTGGQQDTAR
jgi:hypothetical protein